jgi:hypothetical protein
MSEFCLTCLNKQFNKKYSKKEVVFSPDFCEGCLQWKPCVISIRRKNGVKRFFEKIKMKSKKNAD